MYFSDKNSFFHGIMFHHFHDNDLHKKGQGSINKDDFYKLIKFVGRENILDALEFFNRIKENKLKDKNVCLTFDDGIRAQFDIALPVLEDLKIKSFFFVQSSIFEGEPNFLEIYRYFRINCFKNTDEFYELFCKFVEKNLDDFFEDKKNIINDKKLMYQVYSENEIKFRMVRDMLLNPKEYKDIMFKMFDEKKFNHKDLYKILAMGNHHLKKIHELGHLIGLHSHSHPPLLENLPYNKQLNE